MRRHNFGKKFLLAIAMEEDCQTAIKNAISAQSLPPRNPPTPMQLSVIAEYGIIFGPNTASAIGVWLLPFSM